MDKWNTTDEALPAPLTDVLVYPTHDQPAVDMAYRKPDGRWVLSGFMNVVVQVTHWRPLPAPPAIRGDA
ncbi:DUF551 domain-containing protein [Guyparkeria halophila]|uniref:DUF551 domain-containing protein n=1 Tax=Guyparkeria halophila TaxID=47960 RepID=A0ABZ0YVG2_9GAMM|nr:DUF551 domain-containing protein [Guyparkeria halophila]WQH16165.1 DUF551 domain-containing protein [Guyparkeria halophila]